MFIALHILYSSFFSIGNVYIADSSNNCIRKVAVATSIISTIAGTGSYIGDEGAATSASLRRAAGVSVDTSGRPTYICILISSIFMYITMQGMCSSLITTIIVSVKLQSQLALSRQL